MARTKRMNDRGQLLIPFLFVIPSFILITIFLIEVGKLSREKIRQQFALDAASTAEMEQYTDLLNRSAYINGVFPQRIFRGGMGSSGPGTALHPSLVKPIKDGDLTWPIRYGGIRSYANTENPPINFGILHMHAPGQHAVALEQAEQIAYDYTSVYRWLGDVATAQKLVFQRMTLDKHALLRRSLYRNLRGDPANPTCLDQEECGDEMADSFPDIRIRMHYLQGWKHCPVIINIAGQNYVGELAGAFHFGGAGLFQLTTVPPSDLKIIKEGFLVKNHYNPPRNIFKIDFKAEVNPYVRCQVSSDGGKIWPDTTPKYVTRLHP